MPKGLAMPFKDLTPKRTSIQNLDNG